MQDVKLATQQGIGPKDGRAYDVPAARRDINSDAGRMQDVTQDGDVSGDVSSDVG
jgi:hypothetical protein